MLLQSAPSFTQAGVSFMATLGALLVLAKLAPRLGLVDKPSARKQHSGEIPLVGGLAIGLGIGMSILPWALGMPVGPEPKFLAGANESFLSSMVLGALFLLVIGTLDDRFKLGVFVRILAEFALAVFVVESMDISITNLGNLLGSGALRLNPAFSSAFTIIAIFGIMNAFNMLDGLDGLVPSVLLVSLVTIQMVTPDAPALFGPSLVGAVLAFLASNMQLVPQLPKTFLGDAGSKLLGFAMVLLLVVAASNTAGTRLIQPVTALFLVGLPLYDMTFVTLHRVAKGLSPFHADRRHVHHFFLAVGCSDRRAWVMVLSIHLYICILGWALHKTAVPDHYQFGLFITGFLFYTLFMQQGWATVKSNAPASADTQD